MQSGNRDAHIYRRWCEEKGWKYFCRFVFVCSTLLHKLHEQTKFNDLNKSNTKNKTLAVQIFFNLQNHPFFNSKDRLVILQQAEESALLIYL